MVTLVDAGQVEIELCGKLSQIFSLRNAKVVGSVSDLTTTDLHQRILVSFPTWQHRIFKTVEDQLIQNSSAFW